MLQPLELTEVSAVYAKEILELRGFLAKAGIAVETENALTSVAAQLREDRTFHRDLVLHLSVTTHGRKREISYADQLGMLAVAAAGGRFAAEAEEEDAHALLRFLMESRRSEEAVPVVRAAARDGLDERDAAHREPHRNETGKWMTRGALAASLLLVLFGGFWLEHRLHGNPTPVAPSTSAVTRGNAVPGDAPNGPVTKEEERGAATNGGAITAPRLESKAAETRVSGSSLSSRVRSWFSHGVFSPPATNAPASAITVPAGSPTGTPAVVESTVASAPPVLMGPSAVGVGASSSAPSLRAESPANPLAISSGPVATFGRPIVTPTINFRAAPLSSEDVARSESPHLLRRRPVTPFVEYKETAGGAASGVVGGSVPQGVVRQASLGPMAGNVLYSPAPAYPAAASAAHVQGEVKIEAEVDRQGNVASARVVSGPPLLRDAALDAVQRWRFRPYMAAGKPVAMGATAVVDFELP